MTRNTRLKYMISGLALIIVLAGLVAIRYFSSPSLPYPTVSKQRAALSDKPHVIPARLLDSSAIVHDLMFLASDSCEGRKPGSEGYDRAVDRIISRMREAGLDSFDRAFTQTFEGQYLNYTNSGKNIIGWIKGIQCPEKYMVISAHYDHLGIRNEKIYHGASDNATGVACILAMANYFKQNPLPWSLIFVAFDREESGLEGSLYFTEHLPKPLQLSTIGFNLNVDMIARNDRNEIFACGLYCYPSFMYAINNTQHQTNAKLLMGHDTGRTRDNWTNLSDHFAFYKKNIPFLCIGVEDHPDYHQPSDTYDKIDFATYMENCNLAALLAKAIKL